MKKRIGIDARIYSPSFTGIGRYVAELINRLAKIDKENEYFIFLNDPQFSEFEVPGKNFYKVLCNIKHYSLKEQVLLPSILKKHDLDLMHFTHFNAPIFYNEPFIVTIHDLTLTFYPGKKMNNLIKKTAYNMTIQHAILDAEKIIAVSNNTASDIYKMFNVNEKTTVIYEGVPESFSESKEECIQNTCEEFNINSEYIMYSGVWRGHKNLLRLFDAFKIVKKNNPNIKLVMTGKIDPFYSEITEKIKELKLEKDIICTDFVSDKQLIDLISGATAYIFPSLYEGFGLPILEAFACKTPVVCSNTSSLPEIAGPGNALFFDPQNIEEMANKINEIINNHELQTALKMAGAKRVEDFSWDNMAIETLNIYNS